MPVGQPASPRRAVTQFFLLTFGTTWGIQLPMLLGQDGLGLFGYHVPMPLYIGLFLLSSFGATLSAYLMLRQTEGPVAVKAWFRRFGLWRVGARWFVVALLGYPLLHLITASIVTGAVPFGALATGWSKFFTLYLPAVLIFPALINWGEEPGWRGYALTRLQPAIGPVPATLVVGLFHGLWHLPTFLLVSGPVAAGPFSLGHFLMNTGMIMVISIIWTWVFNRAGQSILIAALLHASGNATQGLFAALIPSLAVRLGYANYVAYGVIAAILLIATRGRLGFVNASSPASANSAA